MTMTRQADVDLVLANLHSDDGSVLVGAIDQAADVVRALAREAVFALQDGPAHLRLGIAERLYSLGSAVVPPLEELLTATEDAEIKTLVALVLLQFNSKKGVPWLLNVVVYGEGDACAAAQGLVKAGIPEAGERIIARLKAHELSQDRQSRNGVDVVLCLLTALKASGTALPAELRERIMTFTGAPTTSAGDPL